MIVDARKKRLIAQFTQIDELFKMGGLSSIFDARELVAHEFNSMKEAQDLSPGSCIALARQIVEESW